MASKMIVKIQRPLATNMAKPQALVYNEARSYQSFIPFDEGLAALMGDEVKIYAEVRQDEKGLGLIRIVPPQPW